MSEFFSNKYSSLVSYVPGEQPKDMKYIKLNTNESPFSPTQKVVQAVREEVENLQLYSDPECVKLREKFSEVFNVEKKNVIMTNGSDEALNFAFMAYGDKNHPFVFPDITYGFYPVFAQVNNIPYEEIKLKDDFSVDIKDYLSINKNIVIANPNAPTGKEISLEEIEEIVKSNPDNIVIIDEAYVDFGSKSAVGLTKKYNNLLVVGTFSKSRSMAGARLGFAIGNENLINDLNTIKYSTNPYNVNRMTQAAGIAILEENDYYMNKCKEICKIREWTKTELEKIGFNVVDSKTNFLFAKSDRIAGEELYLLLKENGILIRHFSTEKLKDYNRITIGTNEQMEVLVQTIKKIIKEQDK
ncbi:MAG: histidinol-phosphate transaminase [Clostridia bacterium]|nr:histidinol-phosphate transaminase [Clostridia bacterium]